MTKLVVCPSCSSHLKSLEPRCPHCGTAIRDASYKLGLTACAVLLGVCVTGCIDEAPPNDSDAMTSDGTTMTVDPTASTSTSSSASASQSSTSPTTMTGTSDTGASSESSDTIDPTLESSAAYGVPTTTFPPGTESDTETGTDSGTGTGTGTGGSTGIASDGTPPDPSDGSPPDPSAGDPGE